MMERGARNRAVAETKMNDRSSRSHQVGARLHTLTPVAPAPWSAYQQPGTGTCLLHLQLLITPGSHHPPGSVLAYPPR